jgi:4-hydroxy-tetrahydrodipicolinate synthase
VPLSGVVVPTVTLFNEQGAVDGPKNSRFIRSLLDEGVRRFLVLGAPSEVGNLKPEERERALEVVCESVTFGSEVWAALDVSSSDACLASVDVAEGCGATTLVLPAPADPASANGGLAALAQAVRQQSKLALVAYNVPHRMGPALPPALVQDLARRGHLQGVIDASGSKSSFQAFLQGAPPELAVFGGEGSHALEHLGKGAAGICYETGNILPQLVVKLFDAAQKGDQAKAAALSDHVHLLERAALEGPYPSTLKFLAAHLREAPEGYRAPHPALTAEERAKVSAVVEPQKVALQEFA